MRFYSIAVYSILICVKVQAQYTSPYSLQMGRELGISLPAISLGGVAYLLDKKTTRFDTAYLQSLRPEAIHSFDRISTTYFDKRISRVSDITGYGSMLLPAVNLLSSRTRNDYKTYTVMYVETFMLNTALTMFVKNLTKRNRPYLYNPEFQKNPTYSNDDSRSFFSGHTSMCASNSFFFAKTFADYNPESQLKPYVWAGSALLPAVTGYLRVRAGKHFPTDVIVGYVVGAVIGYSVPLLHKKMK